MKQYYRVRLGDENEYVDEARRGNFIGADYGIDEDLTRKLPEHWREFNKEFIPKYLQKFPEKAKTTAGLFCASVWMVSKWLKIGDVVLCPDEKGNCLVAEVATDYSYHKGEILPHRRGVRWFTNVIEVGSMSQALRRAARIGLAVNDLNAYAAEIENLISGARPPSIIATDDSIEDPLEFALEKHLEDFLVLNWQHLELGKGYDILEEEGEQVGQQYPTDTGPIDILAVSKDKKELLVVELKRGRSSDAVVGQIMRYMGFVKEELAEEGQTVKGIVIAHEEDLGIRRALSVAQGIDFYVYRVNFKLVKPQA